MKQTLRSLTGDILVILDNDEVDIAELNEVEADFTDKMDGILDYCEGLESYEKRCKVEIARLRDEVRFTENKRKSLKEYAAFEMDRLGIKTMQTRFHKVTCVENPLSAIYDEWAELDNIDERCIVVIPEQHNVSKQRALEIYKQTGEIPKGFDISRKGFSIRVRGKKHEEV